MISGSIRKPLSRVLRFVRNAIWPDIDVKKAPANVRVEWNVPVSMRDGVILRVNIFRPQSEAPVPVIMSAHPYGKDRIPANTRSGRGPSLQARLLPQPHRFSISEWTGWEAPDPAVWVKQGYAVINADSRGGGTSEGVADLFSDQEAKDYYELIEWAGRQSWCSGRVGLDGVSYLAISQYKVAALRPPHLVAICPWEGLSDWYRDFARPGGVREDGFSILWSKVTSKGARVRDPIRAQIVRRPERDAWYASLAPDLSKIEVPILVCGSFSDHLLHSRGSFEVFRRAGSAHKWLYTHRGGKWSTYYSEDATQTRIRFFDYTLKGLDNGWASEPKVRLAITDGGPEPAAVVGEETWPPKDLNWRKLFLDAPTKSLTDHAAPVITASRKFRTPRGKITFTWTVPEDMDAIGPMALQLYLEMRGSDDIFLFAGVRKFRSGKELTFEGSYGFSGDMVSKGWQRAAHRELDEGLSTPEQPVHRHDHVELLQKGEVVPVHIALRAHATRFKKGDQLRVVIQGKWFYPRVPGVGSFPGGYQRSPKGVCKLHTGGPFPAYLLLGTRPVKASSEKGDVAPRSGDRVRSRIKSHFSISLGFGQAL